MAWSKKLKLSQQMTSLNDLNKNKPGDWIWCLCKYRPRSLTFTDCVSCRAMLALASKKALSANQKLWGAPKGKKKINGFGLTRVEETQNILCTWGNHWDYKTKSTEILKIGWTNNKYQELRSVLGNKKIINNLIRTGALTTELQRHH